MKQRVVEDRRKKKTSVNINNRKTSRRKEDIDNVKAYYGILITSVSIFSLIGLLSFIWGK